MTDNSGLYLVSWVLQDHTPGHVTLGAANSAGPPHLSLISLSSSLQSGAVWWFGVWFCQACHVIQIKTEAGKSLKKKKTPLDFQKLNGSNLSTDTPSKVDRWFSTNNTFSVPVSCVPYQLFVLVNQARLRYSPQRRRVSAAECHRLGECWVCKSTTCLLSTVQYIPLSHCNCRLHQSAWRSYFFSLYVYILNKGILWNNLIL